MCLRVQPSTKGTALPTLTFSVTGTGTGVRQDIDVVGSGHLIRTDAYTDFGGKDEYPSPLAYVLASLSSCTQVVASVVAKEQDITIDAYSFSVDGDFDPTVLVGGHEADADHPDTFTAIRLTVTVDTDATQEQIESLGAAVERRCPVSALFHRAGTPVTSVWTVGSSTAA